MSTEKPIPATESEADETAVSRAELHIEREKVQIERERLALERERLAAERERWKTDGDLQSRAEGRGIAVSTLVFVGVICVLAGMIAGFFATCRHEPHTGRARLETVIAHEATNIPGTTRGALVLRPVDMGHGGKAYLLVGE